MGITLTLDGIRCFSTPQTANVRPLTVLVGENSSGKTTFLAASRIASRVLSDSARALDFNEAPFALGTFEQIASQFGRAPSGDGFQIRLAYSTGDFATLLFGPNGGHPALVGFEVNSSRGKGTRAHRTTSEEIRERFGIQPFAFAPIRTSPRRTYDPVSFEPEPEGSHVPMYMANLARGPQPEKWAALQSEIEEFGNASGLFQKIEVVQKGKKESDPFQIAVRSEGSMRNLVDVGYGVSQVLPLIVDILSRAKRYDRFLIQQPEVHLHPRAQAELGSFFAQKVRQKMKFMVETHSDHLTDRIRMEVRKGTIAASDVSILYFENGKKGGRIYNIEIDDEGNILDAPPSYRQFFMTEERALLGI